MKFKYLFLLLMFTACAEPQQYQIADHLPAFGLHQGMSLTSEPPIIRLLTISKTGQLRPLCSGTVIDDNYVLTASHCLIDNKGFMTKNTIIVETEHKTVHTNGVAVAINRRPDIGLLKGDFSSFNFMNVSTKEMFNPNGVIITCGYPHGESLLCDRLGNILPYGDYYTAMGALVAGMSGGPVMQINPETGAVVIIGLNVAVGGDVPTRQPENVFFTSTIGLLGMFGL